MENNDQPPRRGTSLEDFTRIIGGAILGLILGAVCSGVTGYIVEYITYVPGSGSMIIFNRQSSGIIMAIAVAVFGLVIGSVVGAFVAGLKIGHLRSAFLGTVCGGGSLFLLVVLVAGNEIEGRDVGIFACWIFGQAVSLGLVALFVSLITLDRSSKEQLSAMQ